MTDSTSSINWNFDVLASTIEALLQGTATTYVETRNTVQSGATSYAEFNYAILSTANVTRYGSDTSTQTYFASRLPSTSAWAVINYGNDTSTQTYFASRLPSTASFQSLNAGHYTTTGTLVAGTATLTGLYVATTLNLPVGATNYLDVSASTQTKTGGVDLTGRVTASSATFGLAGVKVSFSTNAAVASNRPCITNFTRSGVNECTFNGAELEVIFDSAPTGNFADSVYVTTTVTRLQNSGACFAILKVSADAAGGSATTARTSCLAKPTGTSSTVRSEGVIKAQAQGQVGGASNYDFDEFTILLNSSFQFDAAAQLSKQTGSAHECKFTLAGYKECMDGSGP